MQVANDSVFRVNIFINKGYKRYECKHCNAYFWSLVNRNNCGDVPCVEYTFTQIPSKYRLNYKEVRNLFLEFFKRHGHEIVEPRPVAARWREDLYLTIASIVVFQPHVTSGLVPPPANPLVIAQPCIRLEDIDAVGFTLGRHLTNFIMGGHHAFNYRDKYVYWTNETVEYAYRFFIEELGVPEEEVTFKESWWEGGGNAGPCFEVSIGGLEVATLVFMMYKVTDKGYEELPLKIVDTGYGIERITWFLQKTPTAFHAVYGPLLTEFHRTLSLPEPGDEILMAALCVMPKVKGEKKALYNYVAQNLGLKISEVEEELSSIFDLYAALDHTKTIALMLADGVVPSNSGEGYLARLVIRRTLRRLSRLNKDVKLADLVSKQISFWSDMHPNMYKNRERILEMVEIEEEKYRSVLSKTSTIASKFSGKAPSIEDLVEVYDSHGIPPDVLAEEIEKRYKIKVEVPENFYSIVASKHSRPKVVKEVEEIGLPQDVVNWSLAFPATEPLFHVDQYMRKFKGKVLGVHKNYVVLDRTSFYPEGGGQLGDRGYLYIGNKIVKVIDTKKVGDVIIHVVEDGLGIEPGLEIEGEIDWVMRYRRMRHHTATHILLGALRRVLGEHVWQAGAEKTEFKARLDITHYKTPTEDEVKKIEELANNIIDKAIDLRIGFLPRNDAENIYGFTLYQGGVPMTPTIRVVEIPGWDAQACFGTHVRNTSEVGAIKIVNVEKIADGIIRFEFMVATALPLHIYDLEDKLKTVAQALSVPLAEIDKRIASFVKDLASLRGAVKTYRSMYINEVLRSIQSRVEKLGGMDLCIHRMTIDDKEALREIMLRATQSDPLLVFVGLIPMQNRTYLEISLGRNASKKIDARIVASELSKVISIKAGGKVDHVTGIAEVDVDKVELELRKILRTLLTEEGAS